MRTSFLTVLGVAALSLATAANASVTVDSGTTVDVTGPTGSDINFSLGYSDSGTTNPFTETLVWTNTLAGTYGLTLSTTASSAGADNDVDIMSALLSGGSIIGSISLDTLFNNDIIESYGLTGIDLAAGTYTLTVMGSRGETGAFGGNVSFAASNAVPEPGTWAMMLLGFGAVGFAMRRRQLPKLAQVA